MSYTSITLRAIRASGMTKGCAGLMRGEMLIGLGSITDLLRQYLPGDVLIVSQEDYDVISTKVTALAAARQEGGEHG